MKIEAKRVIKQLNGSPVQTDGVKTVVGGQPQITGGRDLTVGDVISSILTTKKVEQFNTLKAWALSQRFYRADSVEVDDGDFISLREIVEQNDQFFPFVLAQTLQALLDAKDKAGSKNS